MESASAFALLSKLAEVTEWVESGDSRAEPYLKADAARLIDGKVSFHRERFGEVLWREEPQWLIDNILIPAAIEIATSE